MAEHGTVTRRMQHVKEHDDPKDCPACTEAGNEYQRKRRRDPTLTERLKCALCGKGMNRRRDQKGKLVKTKELCYRCKRNHGKQPPCGTIGGYAWHTLVMKEKPCDDCREARNRHRSGPKPKICRTQGCTTRVFLRDKLHCGSCRRSKTIIGWENYNGIKIPIFPPKRIKGGKQDIGHPRKV